MTVDHSGEKLGKGLPRRDHRTLALQNYLVATALPPVKDSVDNLAACPDDMGQMKNDELGDCTCAAIGHFTQIVTANTPSGMVTIPDSEILKAYEAVGGYVPGDSNTDNGAVELDVLNYWRKTGVGGFKIDAFASLQPQNPDHIKLAVDLAGGVYIGVALPISAQRQEVWHVDPNAGRDARPGSWGGHAVVVGAYDRDGLTIVTWGKKKRVTWPWWFAYTDESYMPILEARTEAPAGLALSALIADARQLGSML